MYTSAVHNRRGVKARRLSKQSHGNSPSQDNRQDYSSTHHKTFDQEDQTNPCQATQAARPKLTWAEVVGQLPEQQVLHLINPTYHIMAHDVGHPFPFEHIP